MCSSRLPRPYRARRPGQRRARRDCAGCGGSLGTREVLIEIISSSLARHGDDHTRALWWNTAEVVADALGFHSQECLIAFLCRLQLLGAPDQAFGPDFGRDERGNIE